MTLEYEDLEMFNGEFSESSLEKVKALLAIKKEGNVIYICHPRHLFDSLEEDPNTKEVVSIDLDSINIFEMLRINDYGRYSIVDQICSKSHNQFTYIMKKASHMIKKYRSLGATGFSYPFVILEEIYNSNGEDEYFVRGIISCNQNGFKIAFNPLTMQKLPQESVWEKALRFSDNHYI